MPAQNVLTTLVLPIVSSLLLVGGVVCHQTRAARPGQPFRPRRWEAVVILLGGALLALYFAFFANFSSSMPRVLAVLVIVFGVAFNAWLIRHLHPGAPPPERVG
jgi:cobalamin synthase